MMLSSQERSLKRMEEITSVNLLCVSQQGCRRVQSRGGFREMRGR
jgi:hypothetical protein